MSYQGNKTRLIIKDRGTGKSTQLLFTSAVTGYPIIVPYQIRIDYLLSKAAELNLIIPQPMTIDEFRSHNYGGQIDNILIDEGHDLIGLALDAYMGCHVTAVTLSDMIKENDKIKKAAKCKTN